MAAVLVGCLSEADAAEGGVDIVLKRKKVDELNKDEISGSTARRVEEAM